MKRREGLAKLTGKERYVDDQPLPDGGLWAITVRSPVPRGAIRGIQFGGSVDWDEFVIVTHRDIPGENLIALIEDDQPALAATEVRHVHEAVVLLGHPSRAALRAAARAITIDIEETPPYLDVLTPPTAEQLQHGSNNEVAAIETGKGDVDAIFARADTDPSIRFVEGRYATGAQEHVYLETQAMLATVEGEDEGRRLTVSGSMQCPFYVQKALERAFGLPRERLRVIQTATGGGFGGKEEFPSNVAIHAGLLAWKSGRAIKLVYERGEDLAASTKRHPAWVHHRTAITADGRLLAQDIEIVMDAGAYVTLSPVVLSRGVIHAAGPYRCPNVRIRGRAVLSNHVPFGAFRGFGAPQTLFAVERHMDVIAGALELDPLAFRRINLLRDGDTTATGQRVDDGTDRESVLDTALELAGWRKKRLAHQEFNRIEPWRRRGIGVAVFHHGAGFTGSGEVYLDSRVDVAGLPDGRVEVLAAATEIGQGTTTIFTQLAAERLGLDPEDVLVAQPDTARVPDSGPTVASRTAMIVGRLVERAADDLCKRLEFSPGMARGAALKQAIRAFHESQPGQTLIGSARYRPPPGIEWDEKRYCGDAYGAYAWATYIAEVEIDLRTYAARVIDFVAVQEVGKVLNEVLARGQIQGGVVQGIGWALYEDCVFERGAMVNAQLTNYVIPTADDVPPIRVGFLENPYPHGAQGCKGIGELPMDGPGPAIANAISTALGAPANVLPLVPERIMALVDAGAESLEVAAAGDAA